jgi:Ca-activated chloride channel family protein
LRERSTTVDVLAIGGSGGAANVGSNTQTTPVQTADTDGTAQVEGRTPIERADRTLLQELARVGGGRVFGLDEMPALLTQLQTHVTLRATTLTDVEAVRWRDAGVWLLPPLLLLAALLARRGWW